MNIKKRILIPMIALVIGCSTAVLASSIFLFNRELSGSMHSKVDVAMKSVKYEISELVKQAELAACLIDEHNNLGDMITNGDLTDAFTVVRNLKELIQLDFLTLVDNRGFVLAWTQDAFSPGDSLLALPHIQAALEGRSEATVRQGVHVLLTAVAGLPIYDRNSKIVGAMSLGYELNDQAVVLRMKDLTGCEIMFLLRDKHVASTIMDEGGKRPADVTIPEHISSIVQAGEEHVETIRIAGQELLGKYSPLIGPQDEVIGMIFVGDYTRENTDKMVLFILSGASITFIVFVICLILALFVSGIVEQRLKKANDELALQTVMLSTLFDSIPGHIFVKDLNFLYTQCNESLLKHFGITKEHIIGKNDMEGLGAPAEVADSFRKADRIVINEGRMIITEENVPGIDGSNPIYEITKIPLILDGSIIGVLGFSYDITKRIETEREKVLQLAKINLMIKAMNIGLWDLTIDVNNPMNPESTLFPAKETRRMLGYENNEKDLPNTVGGWLNIMHPDDREPTIDNIKRHLFDKTGQIPYDVEYRLMKKNGEYSYYHAAGETFRDKEGNALRTVGAIIDITETKNNIQELEKVQENLRQARDAAEAANRSKSAFLASMSHEIRTPMNSIVGFSELALDTNIPPKTTEYLNNILKNSEWLLQIINDILDISKIESGKMELEKIPFDLQEIFESCRTMITPKASEKGVMLHFYAEPSVGKLPIGDPLRLRQVLVNILSNAVKFTNSGVIKVRADIKDVGDKTITMLFEVKDSGIGMTPEQVKRIFKPFTQAETGTTRQYGGTGLGLAITKNIVEMMGGELWVESAFGIGSKFGFELTFDTVDAAEGKPKGIFSSEMERPSFEGEVLLCEDNAMNQLVVCEHLSRVGLKTIVAENGKIGVDMVKKRMEKGLKQFGLIFMDIHMPVMDGIEASAKIHELGIDVPIVALTANIMTHDMELYRMHGMNDYLGKPFTSHELWRCLLKYFKPMAWQAEKKSQIPKSDNEPQPSLADRFIKSNQNAIREINEAIGAGDIKLAYRIVHNIKSNAGFIGKPDLQQAAEVVETQLKDGENLVTPSQMATLEQELNKVLSELS